MNLGRASDLFRALADETRLRILHLLRREELCVGDIVTILDAPQPTTSRHLSTLRRLGLVTVRTAGHWRHYRLAEPDGELMEAVYACLDRGIDDLPEIRADALRADEVRASGGCCPESRAQLVTRDAHAKD